MKDSFKRWDRVVWKATDKWVAQPGQKGVIDTVTEDWYTVGLDSGRYITISKSEADKFFMLDSKLLRILN